MKVLHVIDSGGLYGAEIMLLNLMKEQQNMNMNSMLLSIEGQYGSSESSLGEEAVRRGLNAEKMMLNKGYSFANALKIINFAREHNMNLIHSHGYKGNILLGSVPRLLRKIPVMSTIHGWTATRRYSRMWLYVLLDKICLRRMDAIVNVNSFAPHIGGSIETFVIENGMPELKFDPEYAIESDPGVRNFCKDSYIVGTLSRLSDEKGLVYLIEAMRLLSDSIRNIKAIIIGEGPQRELLQGIIKKNGLTGKILLTGYRSNAYQYLPLFDVFVLPSLTEGLPITILEAMQAELPIVASGVGGVPSVLENGKYGITVKPADPGALSQAIRYLRTNPDEAHKIANMAREVALKKYSSSRMAEEYMMVYQTVLDKWKQ